MLTGSGILLLVAGAILIFAVDRQLESVGVQLAGWVLVAAGGGAAPIVAMLRAAALESTARRDVRRDEMVQVTGSEGWSA